MFGRQSRREPGRGRVGPQLARGQRLDDHHGGGGRVQVCPPPVEREELKAGRDGDLFALPRKRAVAQQRVHQSDAGRRGGGAITQRCDPLCGPGQRGSCQRGFG